MYIEVFWLFEGDFKVSSGTVSWYRNSEVPAFGNSDIASPKLCKNAYMHI